MFDIWLYITNPCVLSVQRQGYILGMTWDSHWRTWVILLFLQVESGKEMRELSSWDLGLSSG